MPNRCVKTTGFRHSEPLTVRRIQLNGVLYHDAIRQIICIIYTLMLTFRKVQEECVFFGKIFSELFKSAIENQTLTTPRPTTPLHVQHIQVMS